MGLCWSSHAFLSRENISSVPKSPGLYILIDAGSKEIISLGQSDNCAKRLEDILRKTAGEKDREFSVHMVESAVLSHQLREMEHDLRGNYFGHFKKSPAIGLPE
jgi:excinuclease UvrABC nuclease subunit